MKNIHVLPTNKVSRLNLDEGKLWFDNLACRSNNQYIYITSDEEIKENWYYDTHHNIVTKRIKSDDLNYLKNHCEKIILTTDQDLIKDGVQSIDDEFLKWFVNNPSCEEIWIDKNWNYPLDKSWEYKIIIPKEEAKQRAKNTMALKGALDVKKETLEEAANRLFYTVGNEGIASIDSFMKGANYQAERMYSDEEITKIAYDYVLYNDIKRQWVIEGMKLYREQFKKK
jgi:hypothetical protein